MVRLVKLEFATPLLAKVLGYQRPAALTRIDVRLADYVPAAIASDLVYVCQVK